MRRALLTARLGLLLPLALAACVSESVERPVGMDLAQPTVSRAVEAWEVVDHGRVIGTVVVFEVESRGGERFFQVRNAHQQDVGMVDAEGRWWRFEPHVARPVWLGSGTIQDGVCEILGVPTETPFFDVPIETLAHEARDAAAAASQK
ncbi:MAG: hypothetical protein H6831_16610 [Planctomycetes bacterium]|nr:hypothetical protein [Planctomycetota bacterium]MCB9906024.1 hypothetical protein [Planctomycetota bacterium]